MRIAVTHVTRLEFSGEVRETVMDTHLGPRDDVDQRVARFSMHLEPAGRVRRYEDGFGNIAHLLTNVRPHTYLQVSTDSEIHTYMTDPFQLAPRPPRPLDVIEMADCLDPSPLVPSLPVLEEMATPFRSDDEGLFDGVRRMSELIHHDFAYRAGVTDVTTSIEQIVDGRQGVCQDFTHLLLGMCRSIGIPARYASGYIAEHGDTADINAPSRGVGASHAWVEAFTPTHGWRGFDPTNNLVANEYYVKIAIGRDYSDVPPTRGTYHGGPSESLSVAVTARALD